jgi:hypothetical protein
MDLEAKCFICSQETETILHVLWECPLVRDVWGVCDRKIQKMGAVVADFRELMEIFSKKSNTEELGLIATISRNLWKRRNTVLYGGLLTHSNRLAYEARESLENFLEANVKEGQSNEAQSAVGDDLEV